MYDSFLLLYKNGMANFKFTNCLNIEGLYVVEPEIFSDERGYNFEAYNAEVFRKNGLNMTFVQDNRSTSNRGVLRGLHFKKKYQQGKLVSVCTWLFSAFRQN